MIVGVFRPAAVIVRDIHGVALASVAEIQIGSDIAVQVLVGNLGAVGFEIPGQLVFFVEIVVNVVAQLVALGGVVAALAVVIGYALTFVAEAVAVLQTETDAGLGIVAMMTNSFLLLPVIGFPFVAEAGSSLIQLFSKKFFHRKIFISAPLHHHLEAKGWGEAKIVMRSWIVASVFAIVGVFIAAVGGAI